MIKNNRTINKIALAIFAVILFTGFNAVNGFGVIVNYVVASIADQVVTSYDMEKMIGFMKDSNLAQTDLTNAAFKEYLLDYGITGISAIDPRIIKLWMPKLKITYLPLPI